MEKEIIMYSQGRYSAFVALARDLLERYKIPYNEIKIDNNQAMIERVKSWTGGHHVPTLVLAAPGTDLPISPPTPLEPNQSPRGINRGTMLTEPTNKQLEDWLYEHGFLKKPYSR